MPCTDSLYKCTYAMCGAKIKPCILQAFTYVHSYCAACFNYIDYRTTPLFFTAVLLGIHSSYTLHCKAKACSLHHADKAYIFHCTADKLALTPTQLKDDVCSPAGTSIQAIRTLEKAGFRGIVMDAVHAASKRALELSKVENGESKDTYVKR